MDDARRARARLALSLADAVARDDDAADPFLVEGFDSLEEAAAHAHLNGFLLALLADLRRETPAETTAFVRRMLGSA